jgi:acetylornithine deacetylase/succinyl-diaminopimelate desuccinylase-like protein
MPTGCPPEEILAQVLDRWRAEVLPLLDTYARIPDLSPAFDPAWAAAGHLEEAARLLAEWASRRPLPGATVDVVRLPGLTPTVVVEVPATDPDATGTVLVYGHYDKQPPFEGWTGDRGPWTPVLEGDRLYARGVADDGYALPSTLVALEALAAAGGRHGRVVVIAEGSEESGSPHLPEVLDHLADRIGVPDLVVALDSGCPTYDRLWITTSLRGMVDGTLTVSVLDHGVHSGSAGGVVPSSFRLMRRLLDRIEDPVTGDLLLPEFRADPPDWARADARTLAGAVAAEGGAWPPFPAVDGLRFDADDPAARTLRNAWLASVAVVGADGLPPTGEAGNVLRPSTSLRLVIRIPPTCDADAAAAALERALLAEPPSGARIEWTDSQSAGGWAARPFAPWLDAAVDAASVACFGAPAARFGEGGTIPFMGWLADRFPGAQLLAAGVLGPGSNAHGPDESLHLPTAERVTASLGVLFNAHAGRAPA